MKLEKQGKAKYGFLEVRTTIKRLEINLKIFNF